MNKENMLIDTLSRSNALIKALSIYVDKSNRKEYLKFSKYELKCKIYNSGIYTLVNEDDFEDIIYARGNNFIKDDEGSLYYEHEENQIIICNTAGTFLCDFLNCNFSDYCSLMEFTDKYSVTILFDILKEHGYDRELKSLYTMREYEDVVEEISDLYGDLFEQIKSAFIFDIDNCYNIYNEESKNGLTPYEIYTIAMCSNKGSKSFSFYDSSKIYLQCDTDMSVFNEGIIYSKEKHVIENVKAEKENIIPSPYIISSLDLKQILFIEFKELLCIDKFPIKKCRNCEKYFVPDKRTDELYCNNFFEDTGKTCKEIGFFAFNQRKLKEDDIARLYRNTYQQKLLRVTRNPENIAYILDLQNFKDRYKEIKIKLATGEMTREEFKEWLLKMKK